MSEFTSPYARSLGLRLHREATRIRVTMPSSEDVLGRPGFLHGGAIGGLLDYAAWVTLIDALDEGVRIRPIVIAVDFMRGGQLREAHACATIVRLGRRVANVTAIAWQDDEGRPIASANLKFLIERGEVA